MLRPVSSKKNNEENPLQKKKISRPPGPKKEENTEENLDLVSPRCTIIIRRVCTISFSPPSTFYPPIPPLPLRVPPLFLFAVSSIRSPSAPTSFFHPTRSSLCAHSRLFILLEVRNPPAPTPFHPTSSSSRSSPQRIPFLRHAHALIFDLLLFIRFLHSEGSSNFLLGALHCLGTSLWAFRPALRFPLPVSCYFTPIRNPAYSSLTGGLSPNTIPTLLPLPVFGRRSFSFPPWSTGCLFSF